MRISDAIQVIPTLVLALVISGILGPSATNVTLALAFVFTPGFVRLVRGQVVSVREETYVEASRSIGAKTGFIIRNRAAQRGVAAHRAGRRRRRVRAARRSQRSASSGSGRSCPLRAGA